MCGTRSSGRCCDVGKPTDVRYSDIRVTSDDIDTAGMGMSADVPEAEASEEMALARRLKFAREHIGLLQDDVATALDIPRASVSAIESGKRRVSLTGTR